ncbi:MAG TPA: FAD:protein FMN transferase [Bacteroidota bacterium]|nr:FAD:protein FMN transferase [Bacteroidota bacterium]
MNSRRTFLKLSTGLLLGTTLRPFQSFAKTITPMRYVERAAFAMGSIVTFKAYCGDEARCNLAIDEAISEMKSVDRLMSVFDEQSQLSAVNNRAFDKELVVDTRIIEVLQSAKKYSALTGGAFDITVEPLMELYGFRDDKSIHHFPTDKQIAITLDAVGMRNVAVDASRSTVNLRYAQTKLDLGGIAVGFAIDRAITILKEHGIESALVNHSGDIYALGAPPDEEAWEVGIVDPMEPENIITSVTIRDQALSTSGNYENSIEADGGSIGHILDPASGRTASKILSSTVIAPTASGADALSTGMFVLGIDKSRNIIRQSDAIRCIAVIRDGGRETILDLA